MSKSSRPRKSTPLPEFGGFSQWAGAASITGPSYSLRSRMVLAVFLMILALLSLRGQTWAALVASDAVVAAVFGAALIVVLLQCVSIFRGVTTLDDRGIRQTGVWTKAVEWEEVKSARFLGMPWVAPVIPPKLILRTHAGGYLVFQGGTDALHKAFAEVVVYVQSRPFVPAPGESEA